jgi:hypothetical protein
MFSSPIAAQRLPKDCVSRGIAAEPRIGRERLVYN